MSHGRPSFRPPPVELPPILRGECEREHKLGFREGYEQGYLVAVKELKEPIVQLAKYKPLTERIGVALEKSIAAPIPMPVPALVLPTPAAAPPVPTPASPVMPTPIAATEYNSNCLDELTTNELHSALLYWIDLLTDKHQTECLRVAQAIAAELDNDKPAPVDMKAFYDLIINTPADKLKQFLVQYQVVGPNSLIDQLKVLNDTNDIAKLEAIDKKTLVRDPARLAV